jgi:hypothetical protein
VCGSNVAGGDVVALLCGGHAQVGSGAPYLSGLSYVVTAASAVASASVGVYHVRAV